MNTLTNSINEKLQDGYGQLVHMEPGKRGFIIFVKQSHSQFGNIKIIWAANEKELNSYQEIMDPDLFMDLKVGESDHIKAVGGAYDLILRFI